jgi:hypothetical protein
VAGAVLVKKIEVAVTLRHSGSCRPGQHLVTPPPPATPGVTIDAGGRGSAVRQKELGEQFAAPLEDDEAEWLDAPLR